MSAPVNEQAVPQKPKRSLFNRPSWAREEPSTGVAPSDVFSRSSTSVDEIVAAQERKQRAKQRKRQEAESKRDSGLGSAQKDKAKRRRISVEDHVASGIGDSSPVGKSPSGLPNRHVASSSTLDNSPAEKRVAPKRSSTPANTIVLDDASDDEVKSWAPPTIVTADAHHSDEDQEFAELAAEARERRRRHQELEARSETPTLFHAQASTSTLAPTPPPPPVDPVIQLLVSSPLPDTRPLIVHRKLSQRLQEIREVWCKKQGFKEPFTSSVFLIYKMRRLYDVTTCKSLGIQVDAEGKLVAQGVRSVFDEDEDDGRVHVLAVTDEIYAQLKKNKAQGALHSFANYGGDNAGSDHSADMDGGVALALEEEAYIRVVLKAKGHKDFKLKVKPETTFAKIIGVYRKTHAVANDANIFLDFDGERLNPDEEMRDSDIADMDSIDVHIR